MNHNPTLSFLAGVAGFHRGVIYKADAEGNPIPGTAREAWPWQKNLVLNSGLDQMGDNSNYVDRVQVGEGNSTPDPEDTSLDSPVAISNSTVGNPVRSSSSDPYYAYYRHVYRFNAGVAAGNLAEVGVTMTGSSNLFSRSLIKDGGGNPIVITILSDEILDVTYEVRWYPIQTDVLGTCEVNENVHDFIARACTVTSNVGGGGTGGFQQGWGAGTSLGYARYGMQTVRGVGAYSGDIGAVTGNPAGVLTQKAGGATAHAYVPGSLERLYTIGFSLGEANDASGIRSIRYAFGPTCWQVQLDPPVVKTPDDQAQFDVKVSWGRMP